MSNLTFVIGASIFVYLLLVAFNTVMLFSYFQRRNLVKSDSKYWRHWRYALLFSLAGPASLYAITTSACFSFHGLKWWRQEWHLKSLNWYVRYTDVKTMLAREEQWKMSRRNKNRNGYIDIW